jgi:hypothetical protein
LTEGWGAESPTDSGMSRSPFAVGPAISDCTLDMSCSGWVWILDFSTWKGAPVMHWCTCFVQFDGHGGMNECFMPGTAQKLPRSAGISLAIFAFRRLTNFSVV